VGEVKERRVTTHELAQHNLHFCRRLFGRVLEAVFHRARGVCWGHKLTSFPADSYASLTAGISTVTVLAVVSGLWFDRFSEPA